MRAAPALVLALVLLGAACGGGSESLQSVATTTPATSAGGCREVSPPAPKPDGGRTAPTGRLAPGKTWAAVVRTSCGSFTITLDVADSPRTTASFVALAKGGFFDRTLFHRIVPGFVIQGGDPTATGSGGPGYLTVDRPPRDAAYTRGVVAMAKAQTQPPGTAGSQFFVVTGADARLPPDYALLGKVTSGLAVVERIGRLGDPATEQPTQPVVIEGITIRAS